jgi:hypothetical protein
MGEMTLAELCRRYKAVQTRIGQSNGTLPWDAGDARAKRNLKITRRSFVSACRMWRRGEADAKEAVRICS